MRRDRIPGRELLFLEQAKASNEWSVSESRFSSHSSPRDYTSLCLWGNHSSKKVHYPFNVHTLKMTNPESTIKTGRLSAINWSLAFDSSLAYVWRRLCLETGGVERDQATNIVTDLSDGGSDSLLWLWFRFNDYLIVALGARGFTKPLCSFCSFHLD